MSWRQTYRKNQNNWVWLSNHFRNLILIAFLSISAASLAKCFVTMSPSDLIHTKIENYVNIRYIKESDEIKQCIFEKIRDSQKYHTSVLTPIVGDKILLEVIEKARPDSIELKCKAREFVSGPVFATVIILTIICIVLALIWLYTRRIVYI